MGYSKDGANNNNCYSVYACTRANQGQVFFFSFFPLFFACFLYFLSET